MSSNLNSQANTTQAESDASWYLAATKPRQELRAVEQLSHQGIHSFCPTIKVEKLRKGKQCLIEESLFTSYIFINISNDSPLWHKVRSTRGIRDWIRFAGKPAKVPYQLIDNLIKINNNTEEEVVIKRLNRGDFVRILSGPFLGLKGIFEKADGDARSLVLVEFLGQVSRLKLPNEQITTD